MRSLLYPFILVAFSLIGIFLSNLNAQRLQSSLTSIGGVPTPLPSVTPTIPLNSIRVPRDFQGSIVNKYSDRVVLENVCYSKENSKILLFTNNQSYLDVFFAKTGPARTIRMIYKAEQKKESEWAEISSQNDFVEGETLLYPDGQQPAHCLHDFLFTAFVEREKGLHFDKYVAISHPDRPCSYSLNWCCFIFHRAGVIDSNAHVPIKTTNVCFERLVLLIFGKGRYAPDWSQVAEKDKKEDFYAIGPGKYNLSHLLELSRRLVYYDDSIALKRTSKYAYGKRRNVLIIDRNEATRRVWNNARDFVSLLFERWKELSTEKIGSVIYFGERFSEIPPIEQARLFHHADVIISPHGAQLSNLIFSKPKTVVVEVSCEYLYPPSNSGPTPLTWFGTFPKRLGILFYVLPAPPLCEHYVKEFPVPPTTLFDFLRSSHVFE